MGLFVGVGAAFTGLGNVDYLGLAFLLLQP